MVLPIGTAHRLQTPALYTASVCDGSEVLLLRAGKNSLETFHRAGVNQQVGEEVREAWRQCGKKAPGGCSWALRTQWWRPLWELLTFPPP